MEAPEPAPGRGRLLAGATWAVLLLGLWLWGRGITNGPGPGSGPAAGDIAAVGRPLGVPLPPPHRPMEGAAPARVKVPSIGVDAPVIPRGLDGDGAIEPPPFDTPQTVGWYEDGTRPGARGPAVLVGHVDTGTRPAVFHGLSATRPGAEVEVTRTDGTVAVFTVDDVRVLTRARFDAHRAYGPRRDGRAELRLITCGGTYDRTSHAYDANVVVSAYLTGAGAADGHGRDGAATRPTAPP
ncbi:class F sortase [Streptomyces sp. NPDC056347]|uniref:class F sortase n=1 Tax=Streptomyces sp. NPDC056347 TaxID=3345790 RepID=UPI0035DCA057